MTIAEVQLRPIPIAVDDRVHWQVMVSSHERSGTHFLINSIAKNCRYSNQPLLSFDYPPLGSMLNFHDPEAIKGFCTYLNNRRCSSIMKNHFAAEFFYGANGFALPSTVKCLYIYRDPVDVMLSYKRFVDSIRFPEGPKLDSLEEFMSSEPRGRMMRHQHNEKGSVLRRWEDHVAGWIETAGREKNVRCITYHDLAGNFEAELEGIAAFLETPLNSPLEYPDRIKNTIHVPVLRKVASEERDRLREIIISQLNSEAVRKLVHELGHQTSRVIEGQSLTRSHQGGDSERDLDEQLHP